MAKRPRGRPKQTPADNVASTLTLRLTDAERKACELAADKSGMRLSAWARDRVAKAARRESKKD